MIYPLLPVFLTTVLGANASFIGAIEGAAETTAALLKLASGWWSDRVRRRKPLVVLGYGIASVVRPLVAIARVGGAGARDPRLGSRGEGNPQRTARRADRGVGRSEHPRPGVRLSPRGGQRRRRASGRSSRSRCSRWHFAALRTVFWLAAIPGVLSVLVVIVSSCATYRARARHRRGDAGPTSRQPLGARFWRVLGVIFLFTLGNSTDAFLLLRANQLGVPVALAPILWAALHVVKSASNVPGGALSDRIGRRPTLIAGWLLYALVYLGFAPRRRGVAGVGAVRRVRRLLRPHRGQRAGARGGSRAARAARARRSAGTTSPSGSARCRRRCCSGTCGIAPARPPRSSWAHRLHSLPRWE